MESDPPAGQPKLNSLSGPGPEPIQETNKDKKNMYSMDMARESFGAELVDDILNSQSNC